MAAPDQPDTSNILGAPPENPDPNRYYLFYLHGGIVEGSDGRPTSPDYGPYEYFDIVSRLSKEGFIVISEIRESKADVPAYGKKVANWIGQLLKAGVPASRITVVGASRGGAITTHVSHRLDHREIKYVFLAGLFENLFEQAGLRLHGETLSIYDKDDAYPIVPELFFEGSPGIAKSKSIVVETGLGHGLLYKAYPEWFDETVKWTGIKTSETRSSVIGSRDN